MGLLSIVEKVYPRARWPTSTQIRGYGAWGGVVVATAIYVIQPWDWLEETLGTKKQEAAH